MRFKDDAKSRFKTGKLKPDQYISADPYISLLRAHLSTANMPLMQPTSLANTPQRVTAICLLILCTIAVTGALMYLRAIMIPFVLSLFLFFMLSPTISWMRKSLKFPKFVAVTLTLVAGLLMAAVLFLVVSASIKNFLANANVYQDRLSEGLLYLAKAAESIGLETDMESLRDQVETSSVFLYLKQFTGEFFGVVGNLVLIFVYLMFLLSGADMKTDSTLSAINQRVSKYIWTKLSTSAATGLLVGALLSLFGLDLAFMFGVLTFMLNFIPSVGSLVAVLLPVPIALLQFGFGWQTIAIIVLPGIIQFGIGNVLEPKLMGRSLDLHPIVLLFFLLFWGVVWGVPGMFLAVPITAILKFVLDQHSSTKALAELLAGRFSS